MRLLLVLAMAPMLFGLQNDPNRKEWKTIFNGKNLDGWVVKLNGHELGDNYGDTFRVENGVLRVSYDKYSEFKMPESADRKSMTVTLSLPSLLAPNDPMVLSHDAVTRKTSFDEDIAAFKAAFKDIEALKKVPISAKPSK